MIKSLATFARIHWPSEYKEYQQEKSWGWHIGKRKRLRQAIKANIINGNSEYKFEDWSREYDEYHKNYQWQGGYECAETY